MNRTILSNVLLIGTMLFPFAVSADDYDRAVQAAKTGHGEEAKSILTKLAEKGDVRAQAQLGELYISNGKNDQDRREGVRWIKAAAEKGNAIAQYNLGTFFLEGKLVPLDYKIAMDWLLKSAAQNVPEAQLNIASMFAEGEGVPQDFKEAANWLKLSSSNGNNDAQIALGRAYAQGIGVEKDPLRGFMWGQIAAENSPMTEEEKKQVRELAEKSLSKEDLSQANLMVKKCKDSKFKDC